MAMTMTKMKANTATLWSLFIMMPLLTSQIFSWWYCSYIGRYINTLLKKTVIVDATVCMFSTFHDAAFAAFS